MEMDTKHRERGKARHNWMEMRLNYVQSTGLKPLKGTTINLFFEAA